MQRVAELCSVTHWACMSRYDYIFYKTSCSSVGLLQQADRISKWIDFVFRNLILYWNVQVVFLLSCLGLTSVLHIRLVFRDCVRNFLSVLIKFSSSFAVFSILNLTVCMRIYEDFILLVNVSPDSTPVLFITCVQNLPDRVHLFPSIIWNNFFVAVWWKLRSLSQLWHDEQRLQQLWIL